MLACSPNKIPIADAVSPYRQWMPVLYLSDCNTCISRHNCILPPCHWPELTSSNFWISYKKSPKFKCSQWYFQTILRIGFVKYKKLKTQLKQCHIWNLENWHEWISNFKDPSSSLTRLNSEILKQLSQHMEKNKNWKKYPVSYNVLHLLTYTCVILCTSLPPKNTEKELKNVKNHHMICCCHTKPEDKQLRIIISSHKSACLSRVRKSGEGRQKPSRHPKKEGKSQRF